MYTVDYFIKKFEAIPEDRWTTNTITERVNGLDKHCAGGHCGMRSVDDDHLPEAQGLLELLLKLGLVSNLFSSRFYAVVASINDGIFKEYRQPTPKQRIIAALYDVKKMQQPKYEDISKELAVLPVSETSDLVNQTQTS